MSVFEKNDRRITIRSNKKIRDDITKTVEFFDTTYSKYLIECHRFYMSIVNQAKEQGIEDKDIADFMDSFLENPMTGDHINLMAENYIESKEN